MRIWFNQGYSLAPIAQAMMAADPALEVCVSIGPKGVLRTGPTLTWHEPELSGAAYCAWVAEVVREQSVDVLVAQRERVRLAHADLSCRVEVAGSADILELLDDKFAFAAAMASEEIHLPTELVTSSEELRAKLQRFRAARPGAVPCVKPRTGVNGHGFWKLTQDKPLAHLMHPEARNMHEDLYLATLEKQEQAAPIAPLVLMEYLPGPEVSVDVLAWRGEALRLLARTKLETRQRIESRHTLLPLCARLIDRFGLHGMINLQFRRASDGGWKLLEINARAAGGAVYAEAFGSRLLADWGGLLSGRLTPGDVDRSPLAIELEMSQAVTRAESTVQPVAAAA